MRRLVPALLVALSLSGTASAGEPVSAPDIRLQNESLLFKAAVSCERMRLMIGVARADSYYRDLMARCTTQLIKQGRVTEEMESPELITLTEEDVIRVCEMHTLSELSKSSAAPDSREFKDVQDKAIERCILYEEAAAKH